MCPLCPSDYVSSHLPLLSPSSTPFQTQGTWGHSSDRLRMLLPRGTCTWNFFCLDYFPSICVRFAPSLCSDFTQLSSSFLRSSYKSVIKTCNHVIPWRRQWHPTPILLPGKSHGQRSLVGCSPWGCKESDMTEGFHFHALEKEMATHSSVLAWGIPGTGEPGGLPSMGLHKVRHDWSNLAAAACSI